VSAALACCSTSIRRGQNSHPRFRPLRESHVACATTDGRILVAFGSGDGDSAYLSDGVFVLECASTTWTAPQVVGEAPPARDSAAACMLGRHMVLFGGDQGSKYLADTWILDAETFAWEKVGAHKPDIPSASMSSSCF
jgi:hypothetical protein